jgi:signal transduction histidine kinase
LSALDLRLAKAIGLAMLKASHLAKACDLGTDVLKDALAEAERRADENERLANFLQAVAAASRRLISEPNFEHGVHDFLETIATSLNAARAAFYKRAWHPDAGRDTFAVLDEWCRPGLLFSYTQTFDDPLVIDPVGGEAIFNYAFNGEIGIFQVSDMQEPLRSYLQSQGNETVIVVPVIIGDEPRYFVGFDSLEKRELDEQTAKVLLTAADAMAAAVRRWEIEAELHKAEQAKLDSERERAELLAEINAACTALLRGTHFEDEISNALARIGKRMHLDVFAHGVFREADEVSPLGYVEWTHAWRGHSSILDPLVTPEIKRASLTIQSMHMPAFLKGEATFLANFDFLPNDFRNYLKGAGVQAIFAVPLFVDGVYAGSISGGCIAPREWNTADVEAMHLLAAAIAAGIGRKRVEEARLAAEREREAEKAQRAIAILEERNRIAHDVHDALAQGFTGVNLQLQAARGAAQRGDQALAVDHITNATALARKSLAEARESVYQLRPSQLKKTGLVVALEELVARQGKGALAIAFKATGTTRPLADAAENALLRTAQEGLSNVTRHARAKNCVLRLVYGADGVSLSIRDDGTGFDPDSAYQGMGLAGMRARADQLGARLLIGSSPGAGTEIVFALGGENG